MVAVEDADGVVVAPRQENGRLGIDVGDVAEPVLEGDVAIEAQAAVLALLLDDAVAVAVVAVLGAVDAHVDVDRHAGGLEPSGQGVVAQLEVVHGGIGGEADVVVGAVEGQALAGLA